MFSSSAISPWLIYLVNVLDNVHFVALILAFILVLVIALACFLFICAMSDADFEMLYEVVRKARISVSILAVLVAILCLVPSGKTVAAMYVLPKMVGHEDSARHDAALEALQHIAKKWIHDVGGKQNGSSE